MKTFTFPVWVNFGPGDSGETEIEYSLTDKEADRLIKYGTDPEYYYGDFYDCKPLRDIYDKLDAAAVQQVNEELKEFLEEEYDGAEADEIYSIGVNFPEEFEEMLPEEDEEE